MATPATSSRNRALSDLEARAGGRPFCLVTSSDEAEMAVDLALAGAASPTAVRIAGPGS